MPHVRTLLLAGTLALAFACLAPAALACTRGYSYAGLYSQTPTSGVGATLSMLDEPTVADGHVAAWVGVGGPALGPHGSDEWLQVGLASFADSRGGHLYYELALPGQKPQYTEIGATLRPGQKVHVAVFELPFVPNTWVVVSSVGVAGPFFLPQSHAAWGPVATAESWDAGGSRCNRYSYRFDGVQLARRNGTWRPLRNGLKLQDPGLRLRRFAPSSFTAASV